MGFGLESWQILAPNPPASLKPSSHYPTAKDIAAHWMVAEKPSAIVHRRRRRKPKG